jgi:hypothetical protein
MLMLSLFAAPALFAARGADNAADGHTQDLIRQHQEATSPYSPMPDMQDRQVQSGAACGQQEGTAMGKEETYVRDIAPGDEPMIRPAGSRAKRIRV